MNGNDINAVGNGLYDVSFSQNDCFSSAYSSYLFTGCMPKCRRTFDADFKNEVLKPYPTFLNLSRDSFSQDNNLITLFWKFYHEPYQTQLNITSRLNTVRE